MRDFVHVTLVFDDVKWVQAHKMILAACNCLCLAETGPLILPCLILIPVMSMIGFASCRAGS